MSHAPSDPKQYVCEECQIVHAGTPLHDPGAGADHHDYEAPDSCGGCGESSFVPMSEWAHHHE